MVEHIRGDANLPVQAARDALSVRRVFGDAYESGGATVIPVAKVMGGSGMGFGGGSGRDPRSLKDAAMPDGGASDRGDGPDAEGSGGGGGFGVRARPVGVYVIRDGHVSWRPALDLNRVIMGGQMVAAVVAVGAACVLRAKLKR